MSLLIGSAVRDAPGVQFATAASACSVGATAGEVALGAIVAPAAGAALGTIAAPGAGSSRVGGAL